MSNKSIAIVVLSFDGFKELWPAFFDYFFKAWPNCSYPVYLLNNHISYEDNRVYNLLVGEDRSWSHSLLKGLKLIKEDNVFFLYDDTFIVNIEIDKLEQLFEYSIRNNLTSLHIRPSFSTLKRWDTLSVIKLKSNVKYRNALFANLIDRKHLISLLREDESAWDFELVGNARSMDYDYYSTNKPVIKYIHGIVKGKWFIDVFVKLNKEGYAFNELNNKLTLMETLMLKCKIKINELYLLYFPVSLIEKIRNKK